MFLSILIFLLILLLAGGTLLLATAYTMARAILQPPRMTDAKAAWVLKRLSPGDLGLPFQPLSFRIHDHQTGGSLRLAAWWIPHPNALGRCALFIHGYADAKVGAIAWAPTFHALGYNILAIDLRAHGESDGKYVTAGFYERDDLDQIINQLRAQHPNETRTLILFGISLGATVAAATALSRNDIAAVILDSPSTGEDRVAMLHFDLMGMPGPRIQRLALRIVRWLTGADFSAVRPIDMIPRIPCPLMIIQPTHDLYAPPDDIAAIERAVRSRPPEHPTVYWRVEGVSHVMALAADPDEYRRRIAHFLDHHVVQTPAQE